MWMKRKVETLYVTRHLYTGPLNWSHAKHLFKYKFTNESTLSEHKLMGLSCDQWNLMNENQNERFSAN